MLTLWRTGQWVSVFMAYRQKKGKNPPKNGADAKSAK